MSGKSQKRYQVFVKHRRSRSEISVTVLSDIIVLLVVIVVCLVVILFLIVVVLLINIIQVSRSSLSYIVSNGR